MQFSSSAKAVLYFCYYWQLKLKDIIWATSWENLLMPYANNKGTDQPARPRSLISDFVVAARIVQYLYLL